MIQKIEVERFTLRSSKPFDEVVAALNSAVGHPDMAEFWKSTHSAQSDAELQNTIEKGLGRTGLMLFVEFDHGVIVRKRTGRATPRMIWSAFLRSVWAQPPMSSTAATSPCSPNLTLCSM